MLVDLLSSSNLITFNIKVAEVFGLHAAIYISELMAINEKAIRKEKFELIDDKQYFTISRKYITERTTLSNAEQKEIDKQLAEVGILTFKPATTDTVYFDINLLSVLLGADLDKSVMENISKIAKKKTSAEKQADKLQGEIIAAQKAVKTTIPELRSLYYEMIESIVGRYNYIKPAVIKQLEMQVDTFADHDLDVAIELVSYNVKKGYNDMQYAIQDYIAKHPKAFKSKEVVINKNIKVSDEVF